MHFLSGRRKHKKSEVVRRPDTVWPAVLSRNILAGIDSNNVTLSFLGKARRLVPGLTSSGHNPFAVAIPSNDEVAAVVDMAECVVSCAVEVIMLSWIAAIL
jgi:hypothetical protein